MAIVIDEYTAVTIGFLVLFIGIVVSQQGGLKIVMWRMRGVKWFMRVEKQPDGSALRKALPGKIIKTHSQPFYTYRGKGWLVGGDKETVRVFGGPQWVYNYNDARPLPLEHIQTKTVEVQEKVKEADGSERTVTTMKPVVIAGKPIDPTLIHAAFENKSIEAFNKLSDKPNRAKWGLLGFVIAIIAIVAIFNLIYTYYYGVNIACAVHASGVQCK